MSSGLPVAVGVDGSVSARHAVAWAVREADRLGAPVTVVAVAGFAGADATAADVAADARLVAAAVGDAEVSGRIRFGDPVDVLVEQSAHARLLVLGNRGLGALQGLVAGSVSGPVAARAHCPVVVVRGPDRPRDGAPVVLGVDGTPAGEAAIAWAFEAADRRAVPLVAVHVWRDEYDDPEWSSAFEVDEPAEQERELLSERLAGHSARFPDVEVIPVLDDEAPVRALVGHSYQAQLLVLGSRGRTGLRGRWGSVSGRVLHEAQCPVVVVRPEPVAAG